MDAVPTGFLVQAFHACAFQGQCQQGIALAQIGQGRTRMLSADAIGVTQVSLSQLGGKQAGIGAAFGRTEFDLTLCHDTSPVVGEKEMPEWAPLG